MAEQAKLSGAAEYRLRRQAAWFDLVKVLIGTALVGLAAAFFPAAVDYYKARGAEIEKQAQIALARQTFELEKQKFYQGFIERFATTGYNQDIEIRIRLARYFAMVAEDEYGERWQRFLLVLEEERDELNRLFDENLALLAAEIARPGGPDQMAVLRINATLERIRNRSGYVPVTLPPSAATTAAAAGRSVAAAAQATGQAAPQAAAPVSRPASPSLSPLPAEALLAAFGAPVENPTDSCAAPTNSFLRGQLASADLGLFRVNMLKAAVDSLRDVLAQIEAEEPELYHQLAFFGSLCVRLVRGSGSQLSNHSFGTAIDLGSRVHGYAGLGAGRTDNATQFAERIAPFFERAGWYWGGRNRLTEPGHFELSRELFERLVREGRIQVRS